MKRYMTAMAIVAGACTAAPSEGAWKPDEPQPGDSACEVDRDGALAGSPREWRTFDGEGKAVRVVEGSIDQTTGLPVIDEDDTFTFRRDRVATIVAKDRTGAVIGGARYTYDDESGDLVRYERDAAAGVAAEIDLFTYTNGLLSRMEIDAGADGNIDETDTYTYDSHGCIATSDSVGRLGHNRSTYRVNAACKIVEADEDSGADGTIDCIDTWSWWKDVYPDTFLSCDGTRTTWLYDDQWRLRQYTTSNGTAASTETDTYLYDCTGRPRP
jgi:hypothetical protein